MYEPTQTSEGRQSGPTEPESRRLGPIEVLVGILVAAGLITVGGALVVGIDAATRGGDTSTAANLLAQLIVALTFAGVPIVYGRILGLGDLRRTLGSFGLLRISLLAIGLGVAGWFLYILLAVPLGQLVQPDQQDITDTLGVDRGSTLQLIATGALVVVGAPIAEELFFRGFVFGGLRNAMPVWAAVVLSSALFGLLHLSSGNLAVAAQLTLFGAVLAVLYQRTDSLWTPIIAHAINNTLAFLVLIEVIKV